MKKYLSVFVLAAVSGFAQAELIDFTKGYSFNQQVTSAGDATISLIGGTENGLTATISNESVALDFGSGLTNTTSGGFNPTATALNFHFNNPVTIQSFSWNPIEVYSSTANLIYALDAQGNLLNSYGLINNGGEETQTINLANVTDLRFENGTNSLDDWWFQVERILYTIDAPAHDVPEPASIALMGLGLAGMAALRRRQS